MIAEDLYLKINSRYPRRTVWIEVSEDNENGTFVKFNTIEVNEDEIQ
jgi:hypothetical protein